MAEPRRTAFSKVVRNSPEPPAGPQIVTRRISERCTIDCYVGVLLRDLYV